jgi:hypothetical protein
MMVPLSRHGLAASQTAVLPGCHPVRRRRARIPGQGIDRSNGWPAGSASVIQVV